MLKASVALADLIHPARWEAEAVVFGGSRLVPCPHRALQTLLVRSDGRWFATVRERRAGDDDAPRCRDVEAQEFERLHRQSLLWPLDYLLIEAAAAGQRLKLRAGAFGVLPLYCRVRDERFDASWDAADLIDGPMALDAEIASHRLALHTLYSGRQLCVGVSLLTERASLYVEPGKADYRYPSPAPDTAPQAVDADAAARAFEQGLQSVVCARPILPGHASLELSGGMDSATVAAALSRVSGTVASKGILLDGPMRSAQLHRREMIVDRLGLDDATVEITDFPPSLDLQPPPGRPLGFNQEYYLDACAALWDAAVTQGHDVLLTGIGGDELFPDYVQEMATDHDVLAAQDADLQAQHARRRQALRLLTPRARDAARGPHAFGAPASPVPATSLLAQACRAPDIARRGLWPINPLCDPGLVDLCHRLPSALRQGRELQRRYLTAQLGADVFPRGYRKETFAHVFPALIATHRAALDAQLRECALADLGLVDPDGVAALLDEVGDTRARTATAALVSFFWLERFARQLR